MAECELGISLVAMTCDAAYPIVRMKSYVGLLSHSRFLGSAMLRGIVGRAHPVEGKMNRGMSLASRQGARP
jgi:hypothetical protein